MQNGEGANGLIRFDAVEIDGEGHRLRVGGVEVPLERKAFAVLLLLVHHPGRVFTRDEILEAVWGHSHVTPGVLNRIMTLLRQALGESGGSHRYLHTVHGVGYRFDGPPAAELDMAAAAVPMASGEVAETTPPARPTRRWGIVPGALALLAVLAFAHWMLRPHAPPAPASVDAPLLAHSVAVLPLASIGGDEEQRVLADGLSENLITTLSQFEGLKVIGRSSSFRFRDGKEDGKAIGAKLGISHLVEGSVQRAGDRLRIGIEVVRADDGVTVWTQRFDRPYQDLFALQDEVALAVAGALQVKLLHGMPGAVETGRPVSGKLAAYDAYLHGTQRMGRDDAQAIERFTEATRLDPDYAQAWSWLAFVRTQHARANLSGDAARAAYAQARTEIDTALRLQPGFGQAHAIRANLLGIADHDWNGALAEFRIALSLVPANDPSHGAVSRQLTTLGRINEAIDERRKYIDGDPLAAFARVYLAGLLASTGRLDEADASLSEAMALEPERENGDWYASMRSYFAILRGDAATALTEAQRMLPGRWREMALALALQIGNDRAAADAALRRLVETEGQATGDAYGIARIYALRGDAGGTFEWLRRDRERDDTGAHHVLSEPLLLRFRDDPRFATYCREAGLPPPSGSEALGIDRIRMASTAAR